MYGIHRRGSAQPDPLANERALAPSTALLALIELNQIFRFAVRRGWIGVNSVGQLEAGEKPRCSSRAGCSPHAKTLLTPELPGMYVLPLRRTSPIRCLRKGDGDAQVGTFVESRSRGRRALAG